MIADTGAKSMSGSIHSSLSPQEHSQKFAHLLMCAPEYFEVTYKINLWMRPGDWQNNAAHFKQNALQGWQQLYQTFQSLSVPVELIGPQSGLPDMVFTANAAVVLNGKALLARFLHEERQGEEKYFAQYFQVLKDKGMLARIDQLPRKLIQEGAGDCLWDSKRQMFWAGYGPRSSKEAVPYLQDYFGKEVVGLQLNSARFYHLDVSLSPLLSGHIIYYPAAFTKQAQKTILERVPADQLIAITEEDASYFACNLVNIADKIILARCTDKLKNQLKERGYSVIEVPVETFTLAGGSACCLTLRLDWCSKQ